MAVKRPEAGALASSAPSSPEELVARIGFPALSQRKLNALGIPVAYVDDRQRYRFANQTFLEWTGKRHTEVIGQEVVEVVGRDIYELYHAYLQAALRGERTGFERQLIGPGRPPFWIRVEYYPDRAADGVVRGFVVTYSDIDQLKRIEIESGQREHRLRLVTDNAGSAIFYLDRQLRIRFANQPFAEATNQSITDLVGSPINDVLLADAWAELQRHLDRVFAGSKVTYERRERTVQEEPRWTRVSLLPDRHGGRIVGAFAVLTDIEDDVQVREALRSQEVQLRLFADNIPGPIAYLDRALRYTFCNQAFANAFARTQSEIYGRTPFDVMPADVAAFIQPILREAQSGEQEYERIATTIRGERRWMHGRIAPDFDAGGMVRGLYCTEYDIHDLKLTEEALAAREEQLRLFTDNIPEPIVYLDADCRYLFVNEAFLALTGIERDDIIGRGLTDGVEDDSSLLLRPYVERAMAGEQVTYERAVVDRVGRTRWMRARIVPDLKFDGTINGLYLVAHDITDVREAQDALAARESQLRAIMDGVPAPVAYIDPDERCHYVNRSFLQYFGLDPRHVAELRLRDVVGHGIYQSAQAMITRALEGEATTFDRLVPGAAGARRWMTIRLVPDAASDGEVHGAFVLMNDIHELKQAQEALRASEAELRLIMDNVPARVAYIDRSYRLRFVNGHNEEWLGESRKTLTGRLLSDVVGEERTAELRPLFERVLQGDVVSTERLLAQPSGNPRWEAIHLAPNRDSEGKVVGIYAVHTDVHEEKGNEEALRRANWMLSSHINNTPLAVLEWDRDFRLVRWSPQAQNIFGWSAEEVLGMQLTDNMLVHSDHRVELASVVANLTSGVEPRATRLMRNHRNGGATIWCEWYHSCLIDSEGRLASILSFVQDVSSRIEAEERLQILATRDALTGLPNRLLLHERLAQAIAQAKRSAGRVGVLFIDLDRFKNVNDTLGHRIGDELLKHVSHALAGAVRESDLLARLGGDEFMVIVEDFEDAAVLAKVAQKLLDTISQPFTIEEHDIYVTSSIGISVYPDDSEDPEQLLKHADVAMYRSKELGRNTYQFLDANLAADRVKQHTLEHALRVALKEEALELHYQPIVRIDDGQVIGAEALLRWHHPEHGDIHPPVFIPLAEESGLIHSLGEWVLCTAARQCARWRAEGLAIRVSVNMSARQFYREDLAQRFVDIVKSVDCEPTWIELEVTETSLLHDLDAIRKVLHDLRDQGFSVAIDDFGTGYSSLTHLKQFPIDTLKIDISFIADLETDPGDAAITEAIIGLARGLGLRVVAEGVGTKAQLEFLEKRGCHCFQGFWISKPLPEESFRTFARSHHAQLSSRRSV
ncbi:MAG: PAS domain-containing protein [Pseudomonadota bacterium]|nr:PAS domain-containing protein [Pseudomonadota bacterium]